MILLCHTYGLRLMVLHVVRVRVRVEGKVRGHENAEYICLSS